MRSQTRRTRAEGIGKVRRRNSGCHAGGTEEKVVQTGEYQHDLSDVASNAADAKKKSIHASEQDRADVKQKREDWEECLVGLDLNMLVFFDESGVNTLMARLRGRSPKGKRLVDSTPAGRYETLTLMSAVRLDGVVAPMLLDGPVNAE